MNTTGTRYPVFFSRDAWLAANPAQLQIISSAARDEVFARTNECAVDGCNNLVMDGVYCNRCREEIEGLARDREARNQKRERRSLERAWRKQERRERFEYAWKTALEMWFAFKDYMAKNDAVNWALVVFVAVSIAHISVVYSEAIVDWLKSFGGVQ